MTNVHNLSVLIIIHISRNNSFTHVFIKIVLTGSVFLEIHLIVHTYMITKQHYFVSTFLQKKTKQNQ